MRYTMVYLQIRVLMGKMIVKHWILGHPQTNPELPAQIYPGMDQSEPRPSAIFSLPTYKCQLQQEHVPGMFR